MKVPEIHATSSGNDFKVPPLDSSIETQSTNLVQLQLVHIIKRDARVVLFDTNKLRSTLIRAAQGFEKDINIEFVIQEITKSIFDKITTKDIEKILILVTVACIEKDPAYSFLSARLLLKKIYKEVIGFSTSDDTLKVAYQESFIKGIHKGVELGLVDPRLLEFDLETLSRALDISRDEKFEYLGIQTIYEKYLLRDDELRIELPQAFFMRTAMGLSLLEKGKTERAIEFYNQLSSFRFMSSTPTLLHAGLRRAQLSSCFLTTVEDDLHNIFKCIGDNAQMSKYSGGVANDWTNIRAVNAHIKSINVGSQGLVPFLKIVNDTTVSINRSGKRRGATVVYLETWHYEIEDFLDLRRNTGDERRRTHDINTANWIPDLFMKRVIADQDWTLFSPDEVPDLHHIYGQKFEERYVEYERLAREGKIKLSKTISAKKLWRKMLSRLFETGHPWMTFKDACNIRSPQDHAGVIHSSNLCTEITLNTSADETAVCNLGSVNLDQHVEGGVLNLELLAQTVRSAIRMLDNVIDITFYPTKEGQNSNLRHRPIGLGIMGLQDALFKVNIAFESEEALVFCDNLMEFISYHAILTSSELAKERGTYESYKGSKWDRGIFPIDTLDLLEKERGVSVNVSRTASLDWTFVREHVKKYGMRNSNTMAIAPTASISNIVGCYPCTEPMFKNIYVKANMSGEFTIVNHFLVEDLKALGLWSQDMLDQIKYYDGNIQLIHSIPQAIKDKYKEAFDIDPEWLVDIAAVRSKWIDQSQSHNVFMRGTSGAKLHNIYVRGWKAGIKCYYYLRTLGATQIEKATLSADKFGFTQKRVYKAIAQEETIEVEVNNNNNDTNNNENQSPILSCRIEDPDCESCQ